MTWTIFPRSCDEKHPLRRPARDVLAGCGTPWGIEKVSDFFAEQVFDAPPQLGSHQLTITKATSKESSCLTQAWSLTVWNEHLRNAFEVCLFKLSWIITVSRFGPCFGQEQWSAASCTAVLASCGHRSGGGQQAQMNHQKTLVIWSLEWQFVRFWFRIFIWVSETWLWFNLVRCGRGVFLFCHSSLIHRRTCQERGLPLWRESLERALCWRSQGQPLVGSDLIHRVGEVGSVNARFLPWGGKRCSGYSEAKQHETNTCNKLCETFHGKAVNHHEASNVFKSRKHTKQRRQWISFCQSLNASESFFALNLGLLGGLGLLHHSKGAKVAASWWFPGVAA